MWWTCSALSPLIARCLQVTAPPGATGAPPAPPPLPAAVAGGVAAPPEPEVAAPLPPTAATLPAVGVLTVEPGLPPVGVVAPVPPLGADVAAPAEPLDPVATAGDPLVAADGCEPVAPSPEQLHAPS